MDGKAGELFIVALMGALCAMFVFLFIRFVRSEATGLGSVLRLVRLAVCAVCAGWFGYVFISLLIALPRILAG